MPEKILIFRLGSLGDTVVALPCFHLIARIFPQTERWVLTNQPVSNKAPALKLILGDSGLVKDAIDYPTRAIDVARMWRLIKKIRDLKPKMLIYLAASNRGVLKILRDVCFFKLCGIQRIVGVSYAKDRITNRRLEASGLFESEASRLARCVEELGDAKVEEAESWDLLLSPSEQQAANTVLTKWEGANSFIAFSVGTKSSTKEWGSEKWKVLFERLSQEFSSKGLVSVGVDGEFSRSELLLKTWKGPTLNLCGKLPPRQTAAVLKRAKMYMGHDSGPLHLAAAVGTPCVAIFSARNKPGIWFPHGKQHQILYHKTKCFGCEKDVCAEFNNKCIASISVEEAFQAVCRVLIAT